MAAIPAPFPHTPFREPREVLAEREREATEAAAEAFALQQLATPPPPVVPPNETAVQRDPAYEAICESLNIHSDNHQSLVGYLLGEIEIFAKDCAFYRKQASAALKTKEDAEARALHLTAENLRLQEQLTAHEGTILRQRHDNEQMLAKLATDAEEITHLRGMVEAAVEDSAFNRRKLHQKLYEPSSTSLAAAAVDPVPTPVPVVQHAPVPVANASGTVISTRTSPVRVSANASRQTSPIPKQPSGLDFSASIAAGPQGVASLNNSPRRVYHPDVTGTAFLPAAHGASRHVSPRKLIGTAANRQPAAQAESGNPTSPIQSVTALREVMYREASNAANRAAAELVNAATQRVGQSTTTPNRNRARNRELLSPRCPPDGQQAAAIQQQQQQQRNAPIEVPSRAVAADPNASSGVALSHEGHVAICTGEQPQGFCLYSEIATSGPIGIEANLKGTDPRALVIGIMAVSYDAPIAAKERCSVRCDGSMSVVTGPAGQVESQFLNTRPLDPALVQPGQRFSVRVRWTPSTRQFEVEVNGTSLSLQPILLPEAFTRCTLCPYVLLSRRGDEAVLRMDL